jgi:hypothetical protein
MSEGQVYILSIKPDLAIALAYGDNECMLLLLVADHFTAYLTIVLAYGGNGLRPGERRKNLSRDRVIDVFRNNFLRKIASLAE